MSEPTAKPGPMNPHWCAYGCYHPTIDRTWCTNGSFWTNCHEFVGKCAVNAKARKEDDDEA